MKSYYIFEFGYVEKEKIPANFAHFLHQIVGTNIKYWNQQVSEEFQKHVGCDFSVRTYAYEGATAGEATDVGLFNPDNLREPSHDFFEGEMQDSILTITLEEEEGKKLLKKLHELWVSQRKTYFVWGNATVTVGIKVQANSEDDAKNQASYQLSELTSFDGGTMVGVCENGSWVSHDGEIEYTTAELEDTEDD